MKEEVICDYLTLKRLTGNYSAIVIGHRSYATSHPTMIGWEVMYGYC